MGLKFYAVCFALAVIFLLLPSAAAAACVGASPTWTTTPDQGSVQTCVNKAVSGDTINVSAGSATWSSSVTFSGKNLIIVGAGIGNTIISSSSIQADGCNSPCEITGFTWNMGNYMQISGSIGWRVDHNAFTRATWDYVFFTYGNGPTATEGLFDHNTVTYGRVVMYGESNSTGGQYRWSEPLNMGTSHAVYVEDNIVNNPDGSTGGSYGNFTDGNDGCRLVVRFNSMLGSRFESHGVQGDNNDGCVLFEYYNNAMAQPAKPNYRPMFIRGGTGVVFHNTSDGKYNVINIDTDRSNEDSIARQVPNWQFCDGLAQSANTGGFTFTHPKTVIVDGAGAGGYPCRDQIGRGQNAFRWVDFGSSVPTQALVPAYFWRNTQPSGEIPVPVSCETSGDALCNNQTANIIKQNRDYYLYSASFDGTTGVGEGVLASRPISCTTGVAYWATDQGEWNGNHDGADGQLYKCTSTNTWALYYVPFTYPHPLQGNGGGPPPPQKLQGAAH